jgi:hypothetical protein
MIVPDYWAEARRQHKTASRQITVRRFGWSLISEDEAFVMAEDRASEALRGLLSGKRLPRKERKVAYNGAAGVPIREEVLARHGEEVITRNAYGARCLNSPRALFADIDFASTTNFKLVLLVFVLLEVAFLVGAGYESWGLCLGLTFIAFAAAYPLTNFLRRASVDVQGGVAQMARKRIAAFVTKHPLWSLRLYRTPAGYRVLATHKPFEVKGDESQADEVRKFFKAIHADPVYVRMCFNQRCFRARLTAKPWRIGIPDHMRPRPGVWPINPDRMAEREAWISEYESRAAHYAACEYLETIGSGVIHEALESVVELHDCESRALMPDAMLA